MTTIDRLYNEVGCRIENLEAQKGTRLDDGSNEARIYELERIRALMRKYREGIIK